MKTVSNEFSLHCITIAEYALIVGFTKASFVLEKLIVCAAIGKVRYVHSDCWREDQMNKAKRKMLEKKGWKVSMAEDFLGCSLQGLTETTGLPMRKVLA